ncbi:DUF4276 family protein [Aquimonas sp.]|jgi:hypothetical protein|uniref:DUF4276 family protein n=1 Tax=Aquimonas sp. TaxID=1872588 RepID=UPI0037BFE07E
MAATHLEILVEEPSMEAFLRELLPRLLPEGRSFEIHAFQGKGDLLRKLAPRLRGYAHWLPPDWRILVVVDRDDDECRALKARLDAIALDSGLRIDRAHADWQLVNRIAIEELEAWYFGDWAAVKAGYPRVTARIAGQQAYRDPDAIAGGTWEAFERILQRHGYFAAGLPKGEVARTLAVHMSLDGNQSRSFRSFLHALQSALA